MQRNDMNKKTSWYLCMKFFIWFWRKKIFFMIIFIHSGCMQDTHVPMSSFPRKKNFSEDEFMHSPTEKFLIKKKNSPPFLLQKKISLCLCGTLPIRDIFWEIGQQTHMNIVVDPSLQERKKISYNVQNVSLHHLLETLCPMLQVRYSFSENTLSIYADEPYLKDYNIQFLLGMRKTKTHTSMQTTLLTPKKNQTDDMKDDGSKVILESNNTTDFWKEMEKNVALILRSSDTKKKREHFFQKAYYKKHLLGKDEKKYKKKKQNKKNKKYIIDNKKTYHNDTENSILDEGSSSYSINRYSGVLSVYGNENQQRAVAAYLSKLQKFITTQVLIEAKIIEVDLMDEYKGGINWNFFSKIQEESRETGEEHSASLSKGFFSFIIKNHYLSTLVNFIENFGKVRTLANPRLTVLNNQSAVLKVARNEVFFETITEACDQESKKKKTNTQRSTSNIKTIPIGLLLYVHPSINFETKEIILSIHPTISRVVGYRSDPTVSIQSDQTVVSNIPIVQIREMDSVIVAKENQVIVTGGLMEEQKRSNRVGIPYISTLPIIGNLFSEKQTHMYLTELVILLKISLVRTASPHHNYHEEDETEDEETFNHEEEPMPKEESTAVLEKRQA